MAMLEVPLNTCRFSSVKFSIQGMIYIYLFVFVGLVTFITSSYSFVSLQCFLGM
jgi:hypothetical protein